MNKLRLDLEALEIERLDVSATRLNGGLELLGMGHGASELSQSCTSGCAEDDCACSDDFCSTSCVSEQCDCDQCDG